MTQERIAKPICRKCGGDNVACDATARWDVDAQAWSLSGTFDDITCQDCSYDTHSAPFVIWEGDGKGKWIEDPDDGEPALNAEILPRLNDDDAINPGFIDLTESAS